MMVAGKMTDFAARLRAERRARGRSQREISADLGVSPQFYNDLEHGRRKPSLVMAERIEALLGVGYRTPREARIEKRAAAWLRDGANTRATEAWIAQVRDYLRGLLRREENTQFQPGRKACPYCKTQDRDEDGVWQHDEECPLYLAHKLYMTAPRVGEVG